MSATSCGEIGADEHEHVHLCRFVVEYTTTLDRNTR
ncbi:hypothetical protein HNR05_000071 [Leifsonia psychrotolerans]|uniref:Uncharacterized protein n=1 Tax=Glaciibacter psychrotolerans TaxID=670054 RepID=A0A7Z0EBS1_9MICO|nr:hypothetical protein [Leifsonia psychrotolerans]